MSNMRSSSCSTSKTGLDITCVLSISDSKALGHLLYLDLYTINIGDIPASTQTQTKVG